MNIPWKEPFWFWTVVGSCILGFVTIWSTANSGWLDRPPKPIGDGMCYESIAFSLFSGEGFRENYASESWQSIYGDDATYNEFLTGVNGRDLPATGRPPLYPALVAAIYLVFGRTALAFITVRIISALCIAIAGGLAVGLCAKVLSFHRFDSKIVVWGSSCALFVAVSQRTLRDYATDFLTEPLALLLTQIMITLIAFELLDNPSTINDDSTENSVERSKVWRSIVAGVVFGLMVLTRSLFIVWLPGLSLLIYISSRATRSARICKIALFVLSALLVCLPWWTRNCMVLQQFMPLGTQGPIALAGGYCDEAFEDGGNWSFAPERRIRERLASEKGTDEADQLAVELAVVAACKREVAAWIEQHKDSLLNIAFKRAFSHWNPYTGRALLWKIAILSGVLWIVLYGRKLKWWFVGLPIVSTVVTMALYETGGRFLVPLYGLLFTLSGLGLSGWFPQKRQG